jgi:hypothetical protein
MRHDNMNKLKNTGVVLCKKSVYVFHYRLWTVATRWLCLISNHPGFGITEDIGNHPFGER